MPDGLLNCQNSPDVDAYCKDFYKSNTIDDQMMYCQTVCQLRNIQAWQEFQTVGDEDSFSGIVGELQTAQQELQIVQEGLKIQINAFVGVFAVMCLIVVFAFLYNVLTLGTRRTR